MAYENNGRFSGKYGDGKYGAGNGNSASPRKYKSNNVNTEGVLIVNDKMGKFLSVSYWARCMSLSIGTFQSGMPLRYEDVRNAQLFRHTFTYTTVFEFKELCEEVLDNIKRNGKFESMSIDASAKNDAILEISNGTNINMPLGIYLVIYKNVDQGRRTNQMEIYPFSGTKVYQGYNHVTGESKAELRSTGNFKKLIQCLQECSKAFTMAAPHAINESMMNDKMASFAALSAITASLGIDITKPAGTVSKGSFEKSSGSNGGNTYGRKGPQPAAYEKQSPGNWNRRYGNNGNNGGNAYRAPQNNFAAQQTNNIIDEPVDVYVNASTLQEADSIDSFLGE